MRRTCLFLLLSAAAVISSAPRPGFGEEIIVSTPPAIAVSPDGKIIAVAGDDVLLPRNELQSLAAGVRLIDATSGRELRRVTLPVGEFDMISALEFTPDGTLLAAGGNGRVHLIRIESGRRIAVLRGDELPFHSISFSPDGRWLAGANGRNHATLWSIKLPDDGVEPIVDGIPLGEHAAPISALSFYPVLALDKFNLSPPAEQFSHILATVGGRQLQLWNLQSAEELSDCRTPFDQEVRDVAWSPDGALLAVCGDGFISLRNGDIQRCDVSAGEVLRIGHPIEPQASFLQIEFAPDGKSFAARDAFAIRVWETVHGENQEEKLLATIHLISDEVRLGVISTKPLHAFVHIPGQSRIAVVNVFGVVTLYDTRTGKATDWPFASSPPDAPEPSESARADSPPQPREQYLLGQIEGLIQEADVLHHQGRAAEARQHREKAAHRALQLAELLNEPWTPPAPARNLITNGSFETRTHGAPPVNIETLHPGSEVIAGWQTFDPQPPPVESRVIDDREERPLIVDWIGPERWKAAHSSCCLDIDGGIRQAVPTNAGQAYALRFQFAGNPETDGTIQQLLRVDAAGEKHEFPFDPTGSSTSDLKWASRLVIFTAEHASTDVSFINARPNVHSAGVALDNVSAVPIADAIAESARELFARSLRFDHEAAALNQSGRLEESRQHAEAAALYRKQLDDLLTTQHP